MSGQPLYDRPTLAELRAELDAGRTSSRALTEDALARIADPAGEGRRAFTRVYAKQALAVAEAQDLMRGAGVPAGPLAGNAMVVPTVAVAAPPLAAFADDAEYLRLNLLILRNTTLINLLDGCAITLPIEAPGSLPIGLSLAGITGADKAILGMARSVERLLREQAR